MAGFLTDAQVAAALSEQVYRRAAVDQQLSDGDIGATFVPSTNPNIASALAASGLTVSGEFYYNNATGFVGRIMEANGKVFVVYRGTDIVGTMFDALGVAIPGVLGMGWSTSPLVDGFDVAADINLGSGYLGAARSQLDDALALHQLAANYATANGRQLVVTGQSLGGGLAGLVSGITGTIGYGFDPAPFKKQFYAEAEKYGLQYVLTIYGASGLLSSSFSNPGTAVEIKIGWLESANPNVVDTNIVVSGTTLADYQAVLNEYITPKNVKYASYLANMNSFTANTIVGEVLTNTSDVTGAIINSVATHFSQNTPNLYVGANSGISGEAGALHNPSLVNLIMRTEGTAEEFSTLLFNDKSLRFSFVESNIAAPIEHTRADPGGSSQMSGTGPNASIIYNTLWKSVGEAYGLYAYFNQFFSVTAHEGAAAQGISATSDTPSIHSGVVKLALGVLRDAISNTQDLDAVKAKLGGTWNFAGGNTSGMPDPTMVVIDRTKITAPNALLKDPQGGKEFGVREIDYSVWQATRNAIAEKAGNAFANSTASQLLQVSDGVAVYNGTAHLATWDLLVVQAGSENGILNYTPSAANATKNSVVIGGKGADSIEGSSGADYLLGGEGHDTLRGKAGKDVLIGGYGTDTAAYDDVSATQNGIVIDFTQTSSSLRNAGVLKVQNDGYGYEDTLVSIEKIIQTSKGDTIKLDPRMKIELIGAGQARSFDGAGETLAGASDATQADTLDFSVVASDIATSPPADQDSVYLGRSTDGTGVELYTGAEGGTTLGKWIWNAFVPSSSTAGAGFTGSTSQSFTNYEHVIGSAQDDIFALRQLNPDGLMTAAEQAILAAAKTVAVSFSSGNPATIAAAIAARAAAAGVIDNEAQDVVIEGGGGDDLIFGTATGTDRIYGGADNDQISAGGFQSTVYGGSGTDYVVGGGFQSVLYGDGPDAAGGATGSKSADIFGLVNGATAMDMGTDDYAMWGGFRLTGGVQQWWQEGQWAYWAPFSSLLSSAPLPFLTSFGVLSVLIDVPTMTSFRYALTNSNQLIVQAGRGMAGQAVIENYKLTLDDGTATGNIAVLKQKIVEHASIEDFKKYLNLVLKAGFGQCFLGTDPLVLDLDGNGLDLVRRDASNVYFDIDSDGFAEKTGWLSGNDGFLARDLNGNGLIDDISELFGNATTQGFAALGVLDSNADAKISATDAAFNTLRVWRDLNGNGVTDSGELQTLTEAGIIQISLASGTPAIGEINGNVIRATASFTRTDGTTSTIADVVLDGNQADSKFLGDTTVSAPAAAVQVNLKGYGNVKDLAVAMSSDATLLAQVTAFKSLGTTTTWTALKNAADDILFRWAGVDAVAATAMGATGEFDTRKLAFLEKYFGYELTPRDAQGKPLLSNLAELITSWNGVLDKATVRLAMEGPLKTLLAAPDYDLVNDRFNAPTTATLTDAYKAAILQLSATPATALTQWTSTWGPMLATYSQALLRVDGNEIRSDFAVQSLLRAMDGITVPLALGDLVTGLGLTGVAIGTAGADALARVTTGPRTQVYAGEAGNDTMTGGSGQDVYVFGRNFGQDVVIDNEGGGVQSGDRLRFAFLTPDDVVLTRIGLDLVISVKNSTDKVTVVGQFEAPVMGLNGFQISANRGIEEIQFGNGALLELVDIAQAVGRGTSASETLVGTGLDDILQGLQGNDLLQGGDNADMYYFTRGDGNDTIDDVMASPLLNGADTLYMMGGISMEDIRLTRVGASNDVTISFGWTGDSITLKNQFYYGPLGFQTKLALDNRVEGLFFDLGTGMTWLDLQAAVLSTYTTAGNDATYGFGTADTFAASAGDDLLVGFDGGDTYKFGIGSGNDTIADQSRFTQTFVSGLVGYNWGQDDVLEFGAGITAADVTFSRTGAAPDLLITIAGQTDTLTITDQFKGIKLDLFGLLGIAWYGRVEQFKFADGTTLTWEDVLQTVTTGSAASESLYGAFYADTLDGKEGNDFLAGADDGDTYIFGRGYGSDTIQDQQANILVSTPDVVKFLSGIAVSEVTFQRDGATKDLLVSINGTTDVLRLKNQYSVTETGPFGAQAFDAVEFFQWADGTTKSWTTIAADIILAAKTPGADTILGTHFNDTIDGGAGNDLLKGGNGDDTYLFTRGHGNDTVMDGGENILAGSGHDRVLFGAGVLTTDVDVLRGAGNDISLRIRDTGDTVTLKDEFFYTTINYHPETVETVEFANGAVWDFETLRAKAIASQQTTNADTVRGFYTDDLIVGGTGNDVLRGDDGADTYQFNLGDGQDTIEEAVYVVTYSNEDTLAFGAGILASNVNVSRPVGTNDVLITISGTSDQIRLTGQLASAAWYGSWTDIERFTFADGTVWTDDTIRQRLLAQAKTTFADTIQGFYTADVIDGGEGNDRLRGSTGSDTYIFARGYGQDTIEDIPVDHPFIDGPDTVAFAAGIARADVTFTRVGNDLRITISGGSDTLTIQNHFSGTFYKVELFTFADGSTFTAAQAEANAFAAMATAGNDTITGSALAETMDGGTGNDSLNGGGSGDTYVFGRGYGADTINEFGEFFGDTIDSVNFNPGVRLSDVQMTRSGNDLIISIIGTTDTLTVKSQFLQVATAGQSSRGRLEEFRFADGTSLTAAEVDARVLASMRTTGNDTITAYDGAETLDGGAGNDSLDGSGGGDTYVFDRGYGADTIYEFGEFFGATTDAVQFGPTIRGSDLLLSRSGDNLVIGISGTTDTLTVVGQFSQVSFDGAQSRYRMEEFRFADGSKLSAADVDARVLAAMQTTGNDTVTAYDGAQVLDGGTGNDVLIGRTGGDTYVFGRGYGADRVDDTGDNAVALTDTVAFKAGVLPGDIVLSRSGLDLVMTIAGTSDVLTVVNQFYQVRDNGQYTDDRIEQFRFTDGTVWTAAEVDARVLTGMQTAGNDTVTGYDIDETLDGGAGNDLLSGKRGGDTYIFGRGFGTDRVEDLGDNSVAPTDTVVFNADISPGDIVLSRSGPGNRLDLVLTIAGTSDSLTIVNQFYQVVDNGQYTDDRIEQFRFADGTVWTAAEVDAAVVRAQATSGNDLITSFELNETLDGGAGSDTLTGYAGADTYIFGRGYGADQVDDSGYSLGDVVRFKTGISLLDVIWTTSGNDLLARLSGSFADQLTIKNQLSASDYSHIETFQFEDGTSLTRQQINTQMLVGGEAVLGVTIGGTVGNDTRTGTTGNDVFGGGRGNDTLSGVAGSDTYVFVAGDGNDLINDGSTSTVEIDSLRFTNLNALDIRLTHSGTGLLVDLLPTNERITVQSHFSSLTANSGIELIQFADGSTWDLARINSEAYYRGTTGADSLTGSGFNDTFLGGSGADTLVGGIGGDAYLYASGDGSDIINDSNTSAVDIDVLRFTNLNSTGVQLTRSGTSLLIDIMSSGERITVIEQFFNTTSNRGLEQIVFADGTSWDLARINSEAWYRGTSIAEALNGSGQSDTFLGAGGADSLTGGTGSDTYVFAAGDGNDVINDSNTSAVDIDVLRFTNLNSSSVQLTRSGTSLFVDILSTGERITIIEQFFNTTSNRGVEKLQFADGTTWDLARILLESSWTRGTSAGETLNGGTGNDMLDGLAGNDLINGLGGNDILRGGAGSDTLDGGLGIDIAAYVGASALTMNRVSGVHTGDALGDTFIGIESFWLTDNADTFFGNSESETVEGGAGNDTLDGGTGIDMASYANASSGVTVSLALTTAQNTVGAGTDALTAFENLLGSGFNDSLTGDANANMLDGGAGVDTLAGGAGDDTYVIDVAGDVVTEAAASGTDTIQTALATYSISALTNVENLTGTAATAQTLTGNAGTNVLTGSTGNDTLDGGAGVDTLVGGAGNDSYLVDVAGDVVTELAAGGTDTIRTALAAYSIATLTNVENLTGTATTGQTLTGNAGVNTITGSTGNDTLDGGAGVDTMVGGAGNDTYVVDVAGDIVTELATAGTDTIQTALAAYSIATLANVENLTGIAATAQTLTGNAGINAIVGGIGNDTLIGGGGADSLNGGTGADAASYAGSTAGVTVSLVAGATNTSGDAAGDVLTAIENLLGSGLNDSLTGDGNANVLNGGAGIDTMAGGAGDDIYVVDVVGDVVTELTASGTDTIQTALATYSISALTNVENLTSTATTAQTLTGNSAANILTAGSSNDTLDGGTGVDTLVGGAGNDTYVVDVAGDVVTELAAAGTDTIRTVLASYSIAALTNVENLTGTATTGQALTGNSVVNVLTGGTGNDTLDGGAGVDTMVGGAGNDTYVVDVASDVMTELAAAGTDTIQTALATYSIAALTNIENLTGTAATGQTLTGNAGVNAITSGAGDDILLGGAGADTLNGGTGTDTASYAGAAAVTINRSTGVHTGDALGDTFTSIEKFLLTANADTFTGSTTVAADEIVEGGAGNDTMNGGAGIDTAGYAGATAAVAVSLLTTTSQNTGTSTGLDTLSGFENLIGSGFNDTLTGDGNANVIEGGAGNDIINGGLGLDTASYAGATASVTVSLAVAAAQNTNGAGTDTLTALENLIGSRFNDTLTGDANANTLTGGIGDDLLTGGLGADSFIFVPGFGKDTINDFAAGTGLVDVMQFSMGTAFDTFAEVLAVSAQVGANTVITFDANTSITLQNIQKTALLADDFRFV